MEGPRRAGGRGPGHRRPRPRLPARPARSITDPATPPATRTRPRPGRLDVLPRPPPSALGSQAAAMLYCIIQGLENIPNLPGIRRGSGLATAPFATPRIVKGGPSGGPLGRAIRPAARGTPGVGNRPRPRTCPVERPPRGRGRVEVGVRTRAIGPSGRRRPPPGGRPGRAGIRGDGRRLRVGPDNDLTARRNESILKLRMRGHNPRG